MRRWAPHLILLLGLAVRLFFAPDWGKACDEQIWQRYIHEMMSYGIFHLYEHSDAEFAPFWMYLLLGVGYLTKALGIALVEGDVAYRIMLKMPAILADVGLYYLIWWHFLKLRTDRFGLAWCGFIALCPPLIFLSGIWSQSNSIVMFMMVLTVILLLRKHPVGALACLALTVMIKPLGLASLPIFVLVVWFQSGWRSTLIGLGVGAAICILLSLPFSWYQGPLLFLDRWMAHAEFFHYSSVNAFNFWSIWGVNKDSGLETLGITHQTWGHLLFGAYFIALLGHFWQRRNVQYLIPTLTLLYLAMFIFETSVHERYLDLAYAMALLWAISSRNMLLPLLFLTLSFWLNLHYIVRVPGNRWPGMEILAQLHENSTTRFIGIGLNFTSLIIGSLQNFKTIKTRLE